MTSTPEKLLVLKERYLLLCDYDVIAAELLARLDAHGTWKSMTEAEMMDMLTVSVKSKRDVRNRVIKLEKQGLIEVNRDPRTNQYRVAVSTLEQSVRSLELHLVESFELEVDRLADFDRKLIFGIGTKSVPIDEKEDKVSDAIGTKSVPIDETKGTESVPIEPIGTKSVPIGRNKDTSIITTTDNEDTTSEVPRSITPDKSVSTTSEDPTGVTTDLMGESQKGDTSKKKNDYYTWKHYAQFTPEDWTNAKADLTMPGKERPGTLLIGAYLLGMHHRHQIDDGLVPGDFNGKYGRLTKVMLEFFTAKNNGDAVIGFNKALDWIRAFLKAPPDSYPGKAGWPIQMAFNRDQYRKGKKGFHTHSQQRNDTGTVLMTPEARRLARQDVRIGDGT